MKRSHIAYLVCLASVVTALPVWAAVVESTPAGGAWEDPGTWVGGVVPGAGDDVRVHGPVAVFGGTSCNRVEVTAGGGLTNGAPSPSTLSVSSSFENAGDVTQAAGIFRVQLGGDLLNSGLFAASETILAGSADRNLYSAANATFDSHLRDEPLAGGRVMVGDAFRTDDDIELENVELVLEGESPLTLSSGFLDASVVANGNEIRFEGWSYIDGGIYEDPVLVGEVSATSGLFKGEVTVQDILQNVRSFGNGQVAVEGHLINNGTIRNDHYGFRLSLSGDLTCNGVIECSIVEMDDATPRKLTMGPAGQIDTILILPEFGEGQLEATSDLRISDSISLGINGTLTLPSNSTVTLENGSIGGSALFAAGATIDQNGVGSVAVERIDQPTFTGTCQLAETTRFTGPSYNHGTLRNQRWGDAVLITEGSFTNTGSIEDQDDSIPATLTLRVWGDFINTGTLTNSRVEIEGEFDQTIAIGASIDAGVFVLESNLDAASYQWLKDGQPIPGATDADLEFAGVGPDDVGAYQCVGDGAATSRTMTLETEVASTDGTPVGVDEAGRAAWLSAITPNPVGSEAKLFFRTEEPGVVRLAVYDVAGREHAVVVQGFLEAGDHQAVWVRTAQSSPGVYFARLVAAGRVDSRKIIVR